MQAPTGTLSIRETAEQLRELENVTRDYIEKEVTSKCVKFQFWANYPFKRESFIFLTHCVSLGKTHKRYLSFIHFVLRQTAVISLTLGGLDRSVFGLRWEWIYSTLLTHLYFLKVKREYCAAF